eukprot:SAG11_NODE_279_length_11283_cov_11.461820_6_plen_66_part_00
MTAKLCTSATQVRGPNGHHDLRHVLDDATLAPSLGAARRIHMAHDVASAMEYLHGRSYLVSPKAM